MKSILEAHGSAITVQSQEGKGTVFKFRIPAAERAEVVPAAARAEEPVEEGL